MMELSRVSLLLLVVVFTQVKNTKASTAWLENLELVQYFLQNFDSAADVFHGNGSETIGTNHKTSNFGALDFLTQLFDPSIKKNNTSSTMQFEQVCILCRLGIGYLHNRVKNGASEDDIGSIISNLCITLDIAKPEVCIGFSNVYKHEYTTVFSKMDMTSDEACATLLHKCGDISPSHNWTVPLTAFPKPLVTTPQPPKPCSPVSRVLQISDIHLDLCYKEGTNAKCGEPLCCRESSGIPNTKADAAGYWGDNGCDLPLRTLESLLNHINKTQQKIDYVIFTGDIPAHDIWKTTKPKLLYNLRATTDVIDKYLGHVPIFPAIGNHESAPSDSFPVAEIKGNDSNSWLYDELERIWLKWLPEYASNTIKLGAFYSVPVNPGLRIISMNMNYCYFFNAWLLLNTTDPMGELSWLVKELQKAEFKGEKVHIIGHIPPGVTDCLSVWSENYNNIINRYENTVTAQFFGHTHKDEFEVFYDNSGAKPRPTNVAYICPSMTPFDGQNPAYRIYTVDGNYPGSSRVVLNHETYYVNLTSSNLLKRADWEFGYSAKEDFKMNSLLPNEWDTLITKFEVDDELFQKFYGYFGSLSNNYPPYCDSFCKMVLLRRLRASKSSDFPVGDYLYFSQMYY